ncbi:MAG: DNA polymerase III subunit [Candidatus Omnitrophica bacterium]|nr:DNA polymerase III subunit [Candidatus Omnitrophota bacterium]
MELLRNIRGQQKAVKFLTNTLSADRVANSYLFTGPAGVGKTLAARCLAKELLCENTSFGKQTRNASGLFGAAHALDEAAGHETIASGACGTCSGCRKVENMAHPDLLLVTKEDRQSVVISEIRKIKEVFSLKPFESAWNICIIEDAHLMNAASSNALLKVLEEPPGKSVIILVTHKKELLLPTVISRCLEIRFNFLPFEDAADIIKNTAEIDEKDAEFLAFYTNGSPGAALEMIESDILVRKDDILSKVFKILSNKGGISPAWDVEDRAELAGDLEFLIVLLRNAAVGRAGFNTAKYDVIFKGHEDVLTLLKKYSIDELYSVMAKIIGIKSAIEGNVNSKLASSYLPSVFSC